MLSFRLFVLPLLLLALGASAGCDEERLETTEDCDEYEVATESRSVDLMLVVDRSSSMADPFDTSISPSPWEEYESRWDVLEMALHSLVRNADERLRFGLALFPSMNGGCSPGGVVVEPGGDNIDVLRELSPGFGGPSGRSPVATTLGFVSQWASDRASERRLAVVLATDGAPNCNAQLDGDTCECGADDPDYCAEAIGIDGNQGCLDRNNTLSEVRDLRDDHGALVFIIGMPGAARFADFLDDMAEAGGTATVGRGHYAVDQLDALTLALDDIEERLGACKITVDDAAFPLTLADPIEVKIGEQTFERDEGQVDGWDFAPGAGDELLLFGSACNAWLASEEEPLQINACR